MLRLKKEYRKCQTLEDLKEKLLAALGQEMGFAEIESSHEPDAIDQLLMELIEEDEGGG